MRLAFDQEAAATGNPALLISVAVAAGKDKIETAYRVDEMADKADFLNVMSYAYHGTWESQAAHHSPLYGHPSDSGLMTWYNTHSTIQYYLQHGVAPEKINLGLDRDCQ